MARNQFSVSVLKNITGRSSWGRGCFLAFCSPYGWLSGPISLADFVRLSRRFADPDRGHTRGPRTVQQKRSKQSGHVRAGWFVADDVNDEER